MHFGEQAALYLEKIRATSPLIHNITNYVAMNNSANALLALGAAPVMAHAEDEVAEMVANAAALVVNIGTLSPPWVAAMLKAVEVAESLGRPIVIDPVGAGATKMRSETMRLLLERARPGVIRGNASEIMALDQCGAGARGVDSEHRAETALAAAQRLSDKYSCVVSVSGEVDHIVSGQRLARVYNGDIMMTRVTGLGCTASAITGAFAAVSDDFFAAATAAMAVMGVAGELALEKSAGPGSMQLHFIDVLYSLGRNEMLERISVEGI